ncbi:MAG: hypothetical protein BGO01_14690 [Armatimonadetes bacterium 55-13]|nr:SLBB domain-containing protein [Armatimonadota bacterium]OJU64955.1 MAG: hypothetical protein BGO01_14690 [Armatimonadetes bacterium 55-13]
MDKTLGADGAVKLTGIQTVFLAGRTLAEAAIELKRVGGVKLGSVGISRLTPESTPIMFRGAVRHSGSVSARTPKTLQQVLEIAQPEDGADLNAVVIYTAQRDRLVIDSEAEGTRFPLRAGDEVVIEFRKVADEVLVLGAVREPGSKPYIKGESMEQAVARAGGLTGHAVTEKIRVLRSGVPIDGADWTDIGRRTVLRRGDVIQVPTAENATYVSVVGFVKKPGLVPFKPGMTLLEAIAAAGGTTVGAGLDSIEVRKVFKGLGNTKRFDISMIKKGSDKDPKLVAADIVFVPAFVFKAPEDKKKFHPVVPPRRRP